jgi:carboxyl-terminal processing protease
MGTAALGLLLLAPAAPVPAAAPARIEPADRQRAIEFAHQVHRTAQNVLGLTLRPVEMKEMFAGAVRGLHDEAGIAVPDELLESIRRSKNTTELLNLLADARVRLGNLPRLSGPRSYFAAVSGFKHALDPYSGLAPSRSSRFVSVDMDFGIGIELDGASGQRWSEYRVERSVAAVPVPGLFAPLVKPEDVPAPATFPWRIERVIPGSPAQRAGVRPGDVITHLDGTEITAANANRLFGQFAFPPGRGLDPAGQPLPVKRTFQLRRKDAAAPIEMTLTTEDYTPETVFGVMKTETGKWNCLLDRKNKIGYIRLGPVEMGSDERVAEMLRDLKGQGCRGLILDLRWCPGGYVEPGTRIAGMLLDPNDVIAVIRARDLLGDQGITTQAQRADVRLGAGLFRDAPLVVLVGQETTGGGELIASALQGNGRCKVMGQRTAGRAAIQRSIDTGFSDLQFKVTTGTTLRPNGEPRQREADSKPTDDWGIRPDPGLEVPVTLDLSKKLRRWADEHALRPADSREALEFDDPAKDPYRAAALRYFREQLRKADEN